VQRSARPSKLVMRVRFPSPALLQVNVFFVDRGLLNVRFRRAEGSGHTRIDIDDKAWLTVPRDAIGREAASHAGTSGTGQTATDLLVPAAIRCT
jgi:hypothetical protein